jgi:hypothetical protein
MPEGPHVVPVRGRHHGFHAEALAHHLLMVLTQKGPPTARVVDLGFGAFVSSAKPPLEYGGPDLATMVRAGAGVVGGWNLAWQMGWVVNLTPS